MFEVLLAKLARDAFESADGVLQKKLDRCFAQLARDPRHHNNITRLKGSFSSYFRYRVGDYRVIYRIDDDLMQVVVVDIRDRKDVYE